MPLDDALAALAEGLGAAAAVVSRDPRNLGKCRVVAAFDTKADQDALKNSFATEVLGRYYAKVRASTLWLLSHHEDARGFAASEALQRRRTLRELGDIAVIPLQTSVQQTDYLELHFAKAVERTQENMLESLLPTLTRAWVGRKTGLVTQAQVDSRIARARARVEANALRPDAPILGDTNPAGLSRAEFRVCVLLARGLSTKGIIDELGLSEATVRTHLRNIYSKTETSGHAELLYRILSSAPAPEAVVIQMRSRTA